MALPLPAALSARAGRVVNVDSPAGLAVDLAACRKILVVRLDFIGDWVLTTPFLASLRRSAPDAEITAVVLNRVFDLARSCRFVDRVVGVEAAASGPVDCYADGSDRLAAFVADYAEGGFDLALVPRWDTDFNGALRIADGSRAGQVIGFSETNTGQRRALNRGDDRFYSAVLLDQNNVHEVEHKLTFLEAIGGTVRDRGLALDLDEADEVTAARFVADRLGSAGRFLAVAPFAAGRKQYPPERTAELINRLVAAFDLPVMIVGSPVHADDATAFAAMIDGRAVSAVGLTLAVSAALIGRATVLIGMDSGPAHIAAALGAPVTVIFNHPSGGSPVHVGSPERFRPWGDPERLLIVQPDAPLPPCVDGCEADSPHCITRIAVDDIHGQVARFVERFAREAVAAI